MATNIQDIAPSSIPSSPSNTPQVDSVYDPHGFLASARRSSSGNRACRTPQRKVSNTLDSFHLPTKTHPQNDESTTKPLLQDTPSRSGDPNEANSPEYQLPASMTSSMELPSPAMGYMSRNVSTTGSPSASTSALPGDIPVRSRDRNQSGSSLSRASLWAALGTNQVTNSSGLRSQPISTTSSVAPSPDFGPQKRSRTPFHQLGVVSTVAQQASLEGSVIGPYQIGSYIAHGSYAVVREAKTIHSGEVVAVKIMLRRPGTNIPTPYDMWTKMTSPSSPYRTTAGQLTMSPQLVSIHQTNALLGTGGSSGSSPVARSQSLREPFASDISGSRRFSLSTAKISENHPQTSAGDIKNPMYDSIDNDPINNDMHGILRERFVWKSLPEHRNVVTFLHHEEKNGFVYLFSPLYLGNTLLSYLNHRQTRNPYQLQSVPEITEKNNQVDTSNGPITLEELTDILRQVTSGLHWVHSHGITHGDIKVENVYGSVDHRTWAIGDFGLAHFNGSKPLPDLPSDIFPQDLCLPSTATSSLAYSAPELVSSFNKYDHKPSHAITWSPQIDMWALGCVLYAMLENELPFKDPFEPRLRSAIIDAEWELPTRLKATWNSNGPIFNKILQTVLENLLQKDVNHRWSAEMVLHFLEKNVPK